VAAITDLRSQIFLDFALTLPNYVCPRPGGYRRGGVDQVEVGHRNMQHLVAPQLTIYVILQIPRNTSVEKLNQKLTV
jgi:hypothetical protein